MKPRISMQQRKSSLKSYAQQHFWFLLILLPPLLFPSQSTYFEVAFLNSLQYKMLLPRLKFLIWSHQEMIHTHTHTNFRSTLCPCPAFQKVAVSCHIHVPCPCKIFATDIGCSKRSTKTLKQHYFFNAILESKADWNCQSQLKSIINGKWSPQNDL